MSEKPYQEEGLAARVLRIYDLLQVKPYTLKELKDVLHKPETSVRVALQMLMDIRGDEVQRSAQRPYRYSVAKKTALTPVEMVVTHIAARALQMHPIASSMYGKVLTRLEGSIPENKREFLSQLRCEYPALSGRVFELCAEAWLADTVLECVYEKKKRRLAIYFFEVHLNLEIYVIASDLNGAEQGKVKSFRLDRISQPERTTEGYSIPASFNPKDFFASAWGISGNEATVEVLLQFSPEKSKRIAEGFASGSPLYRKLSLVSGDLATGYLCKAEGIAYSPNPDKPQIPWELFQWVLGWGSGVDVISPQHVRDAWLNEARGVLKYERQAYQQMAMDYAQNPDPLFDAEVHEGLEPSTEDTW